MDNLASVLRAQENFGEAETLSQQMLEGRERELGQQNFDMLTGLGSLAGAL
jgi:hypothetical protein